MTDRTEKPTPRKLEEARKEGSVVRSIEVNSAAVLLVSVALLRGAGKNLVLAISELITQLIQELPGIELSPSWLQTTFIHTIIRIAPSLGVILLGIMVVGISATLIQTGFLWTNKRIGFDFKRLNPINGFKRMFSKQGLVELIKTLGKLIIIGWVTYSYLKTNYLELISLAGLGFNAAVSRIIDIFFSLMTRIAFVYLVLAAADYGYQRWEYMRNLRMSKQDIKDELKRSEGDPMLKGRIRAQQRRMARKRMMANVPKATVIVTNPTHIALAIEYRNDMRAPKVVAKGAHRIAERIVEIAKTHNVPVVQNIPLAWAIYKTIDIDQEISPELYKAVAEVLAFVYRSKNKRSTILPPTRLKQVSRG